MDKVLIDSSAWIDFFRKREPCHSAILRLMEGGTICCSGIILAELLQGAVSEKEIAVIKDFLYVFEFLPDSLELWERAGKLSYACGKGGHRIGLADCYLSVMAIANGARLLTLDKHFESLRAHVGLKFFDPGT